MLYRVACTESLSGPIFARLLLERFFGSCLTVDVDAALHNISLIATVAAELESPHSRLLARAQAVARVACESCVAVAVAALHSTA